MERSKVTELIQLYVTGCLSPEELQQLYSLMEDEENFPWIELAHYQNLIVFLPTVLPTELPDPLIKQQMVEKLNQLIYGESNKVKNITQSPVKEEQKSNSKIDWSSLSVIDPAISQNSDSEEKENLITEDEVLQEVESQESEDILSDETFSFVKDVLSEETKVKSKKSSLSWLYITVPVIVVLAAIIFSVYNFLQEAEVVPESEEVIQAPVSEKIIDSVNTNNDSLVVFAAAAADSIVKVDTHQLALNIKTDEESLQKILPTPPPKSPELIEAPLVEKTVDVEKDNGNTENKVETSKEESQPPKEEIIEKEEEPSYFMAVEEMPEPIGGLKAIQDMIVYPEIAKRAGVEGKVFVRAFVDETGKVTKVELVKGIGAGCDEIALDAVSNTKFNPGKQRGKPIKVQITVPIVFKLR